MGPGRLLLANTHGWMARTLEHYQVAAGAPRSFLTGNNMLYANGRPNIVGPWNSPKGHVSWNGQKRVLLWKHAVRDLPGSAVSERHNKGQSAGELLAVRFGASRSSGHGQRCPDFAGPV